MVMEDHRVDRVLPRDSMRTASDMSEGLLARMCIGLFVFSLDWGWNVLGYNHMFHRIS